MGLFKLESGLIHTGKQRMTQREQMEPGPILTHVA